MFQKGYLAAGKGKIALDKKDFIDYYCNKGEKPELSLSSTIQKERAGEFLRTGVKTRVQRSDVPVFANWTYLIEK